MPAARHISRSNLRAAATCHRTSDDCFAWSLLDRAAISKPLNQRSLAPIPHALAMLTALALLALVAAAPADIHPRATLMRITWRHATTRENTLLTCANNPYVPISNGAAIRVCAAALLR